MKREAGNRAGTSRGENGNTDLDRTLFALVSGRVQNVGYRVFVQREARKLGLAGSVRNLQDGRVEVIAHGSRDRLELLLQSLHEGPHAARVSNVRAEWRVPSPAAKDPHFEVIE